MLETGKKFPDFILYDQNEKEHSLKQYAGKWLVIYFYPKDNTSGCTTEALDFKELFQKFLQNDAVILGVSPDSVKSHYTFAAKKELPFTLLSDPEHTLLTACGVWQQKKMYGREYMGVVRTTVLVNPEGVIQKVWPKVKVAGHAQEVFDELVQQQQ